MSTAPLLEVKNLRVEFPTRRGTLVALDGVSFDIAPGEVLGVVGESGAGKSLTGAAIIGLLEPPGRIDGGEILLAGRRIDNLPHEQMRALRGRRIGAIFQDPLTSLNPLYTVGRQLVETIRTHLPLSEKQARERAIALLADTGIPAPEVRFEQYPHQFSGGMRQRVVIALALAAEPQLIVADEPTTALDGVSFDIAPGEVLGVVGESGAGKSLTGAAIIGLLEPPGRIAGGEILLAGRRIDNLPHEQMRALRGRRIGAIFQDPLTSLNPLYTVGRQLVETIRTHLPLTEKQARERAIALLADTGIPAPEVRFEQYPHQFSGGMRQRVVIALALAAEPQLIVADEPTTALDVSIQAQIITLLKRICREHGAAVMLVTHDMGVIAETCDRVAVMYAGRIAEIGPVAEVIHRPAHPYTVGLMGSIPAMDEERERLLQIDGAMPRLSAIPAGCAFNPRCPHAFERCRSERPELMAAAVTRAACWLVEDTKAVQG